MVIGAVVVGYRRECTRELTREQQGTSKKFKGKIVARFVNTVVVGLNLYHMYIIQLSTFMDGQFLGRLSRNIRRDS